MVQTIIWRSWKAAPFFVPPAGTGIEALDAPIDRPFDRRIVASIEVQAVDFLQTSPITPVQPIALVQTKRHTHRVSVIFLVVGGLQIKFDRDNCGATVQKIA